MASDKKQVDIFIYNGVVATIDPQKRVFEKGAVAVNYGKIVEVGNSDDLKERFVGKKEIDATYMVVMPAIHSRA